MDQQELIEVGKTLTVKQRTLVTLIAQGYECKEVATFTGTKVSTVRDQLSYVRARKLSFMSRPAFVHLAIACGWLQIGEFER